MSDIEPGWYADPNSPENWRWWDGNAWTEATYQGDAPENSGSEVPSITYDSDENDTVSYTPEESGSRMAFFIIVIIIIIGLILIAMAA